MKLNEMLPLLNKELEVLKGIRIEDATEYHNLKRNTLAKLCESFGLKTELWKISYELGNDMIYRRDVPIFDIKLDIKKDKRYNFKLVGRINKVELTYSEGMEKYADTEFEEINNLYIRDCLSHIIKEKEEKIQKRLKEIEEEKESILKYQTELERIQNEI